MIIDIIDKLIDRIIQMKNYSKSKDLEFFAENIEILHLQFNNVHDDYLLSLKRYREALTELNVDYEKLLNIIKKDHLVTLNLRNKISTLTGVIRKDKFSVVKNHKTESKRVKRQELILKYFYKIENYLFGNLQGAQVDFGIQNIVRSTLYDGISFLKDYSNEELNSLLQERNLTINRRILGDESGKTITKEHIVLMLGKSILNSMEHKIREGDHDLKKIISIEMIDKLIISIQQQWIEVYELYLTIRKEYKN